MPWNPSIKMAERVGFEPTIELPLYSISNAAPSTTRPSLRFGKRQSNNILRFQEKIKAKPEKKSKKMAERGGFEPPVEFDPYDGLANRSFRPLRHLSATVQNVFYTILRFRVKSRRILKKSQKRRRGGQALHVGCARLRSRTEDKSLTEVVPGLRSGTIGRIVPIRQNEADREKYVLSAL